MNSYSVAGQHNLVPDITHDNTDNEKLVIIVNQTDFIANKYRTGSDVDVFNIIGNIKKLKCNYDVFNNLNHHDLMENLPRYVASKLQQLNEMDGLIFFILTHGNTGDILYATDQSFNLYDFVNKFQPSALPFMATKPKLFFVSACRGASPQMTANVNILTGAKTMVDGVSFEVEPSRQMYKQLLIAFGTYKNYFGMRAPISGTFFIDMLCDRLDEFIRNTEIKEVDIMDVLVKTNNKLVQKDGWLKDSKTKKTKKVKQLAQVYSSLLRPYYLRKN